MPMPLGTWNIQNNKGGRMSHPTDNLGRLNNMKLSRNLILYIILFPSTSHIQYSSWNTRLLFQSDFKQRIGRQEARNSSIWNQKYEIQGPCYSLHMYKWIQLRGNTCYDRKAQKPSMCNSFYITNDIISLEEGMEQQEYHFAVREILPFLKFNNINSRRYS